MESKDVRIVAQSRLASTSPPPLEATWEAQASRSHDRFAPPFGGRGIPPAAGVADGTVIGGAAAGLMGPSGGAETSPYASARASNHSWPKAASAFSPRPNGFRSRLEPKLLDAELCWLAADEYADVPPVAAPSPVTRGRFDLSHRWSGACASAILRSASSVGPSVPKRAAAAREASAAAPEPPARPLIHALAR
eukprot:scaffold280945_cov32-Tisochrysis_lutea.AAC.5